MANGAWAPPLPRKQNQAALDQLLAGFAPMAPQGQGALLPTPPPMTPPPPPPPAPMPVAPAMEPAAAAAPPTAVDALSALNAPDPDQLTPEQRQLLMDQMKRQQELMDVAAGRRRGSLDILKQSLLDKKQQPAGMDLTGGFMLADLLNRQQGQQSTLAANYAASGMRPETENQRQKAIRDMEFKIDAAEQDALDSELRASQAQIKAAAGMFSNPQKAKQDAIDRRFARNKLHDTQKELKSDYLKTTKDFVENKNQFAQLKSAVETRSLQMIKMNAAKFARVVAGEKGVLTDKDVGRAAPGTALRTTKELELYLTEQADVGDAKWVDTMLKAIEIAMEKKRDEYISLAKAHRDSVNTFERYKPIREEANTLWDTYEKDVKDFYGTGKKSGPQSDQDLDKMTDEELKAYLGEK